MRRVAIVEERPCTTQREENLSEDIMLETPIDALKEVGTVISLVEFVKRTRLVHGAVTGGRWYASWMLLRTPAYETLSLGLACKGLKQRKTEKESEKGRHEGGG